jgi:hypothetical protein
LRTEHSTHFIDDLQSGNAFVCAHKADRGKRKKISPCGELRTNFSLFFPIRHASFERILGNYLPPLFIQQRLTQLDTKNSKFGNLALEFPSSAVTATE